MNLASSEHWQSSGEVWLTSPKSDPAGGVVALPPWRFFCLEYVTGEQTVDILFYL
jgi:hypothetical protein